MKDTYKAVEVSAPGVLRVVERPVSEPGAGQVRIRVEACGICHTWNLSHRCRHGDGNLPRSDSAACSWTWSGWPHWSLRQRSVPDGKSVNGLVSASLPEKMGYANLADAETSWIVRTLWYWE